jgi:hypothetical protein
VGSWAPSLPAPLYCNVLTTLSVPPGFRVAGISKLVSTTRWGDHAPTDSPEPLAPLERLVLHLELDVASLQGEQQALGVELETKRRRLLALGVELETKRRRLKLAKATFALLQARGEDATQAEKGQGAEGGGVMRTEEEKHESPVAQASVMP